MGRGSLAGPVVVAAVMIDQSLPIDGVDDSKRLSPRRRTEVSILASRHRHCVTVVPVERIEELNILGATMLGMYEAISPFLEEIYAGAVVVVDGNLKIPGLPEDRQEAVIKGDSKSACVAAASVLAKVYRDGIMESLESSYPGYSFKENKGYGSPGHIKAIRSLGLSNQHRVSFCRRIFSPTPPPPNDAFLLVS